MIPDHFEMDFIDPDFSELCTRSSFASLEKCERLSERLKGRKGYCATGTKGILRHGRERVKDFPQSSDDLLPEILKNSEKTVKKKIERRYLREKIFFFHRGFF